MREGMLQRNERAGKTRVLRCPTEYSQVILHSHTVNRGCPLIHLDLSERRFCDMPSAQ
jgi:hypothetical protein